MNKLPAFTALCLASSLACAHVTIDPPRVEAGTTWRGVLRVGHGCDGKNATTAIEARLPAQATQVRAGASPMGSPVVAGSKVEWKAPAGQALDARSPADLPLQFQAPSRPGPLWIAVTQRCEGGVASEWSTVPKQGTSTEGLKTPALLLQVVSEQEAAAYAAQPAVEGAWIRAAVPGQQATGAFMRITAKEPTTLVGVSTPVAGTAEVHEMKMEGDVMRMRPAGPIELPVGQAFELKPGGYHLMLQDLKQAVPAGATVPLTLVFRNAKGVETRMDLKVPAALQPPAGNAPTSHKH